MTYIYFLVTILLLVPIVHSDDNAPIPADRSQLDAWFNSNVGQLASRTSSLKPALVTAEANAKVIKVRADGSGDFKTINDAVKSIPANNQHRVIVSIGPGTYTEKIRIPRGKNFVTFYGDPKNVPTIIFGDTGATTGTLDSGTLLVEGEHFVAVNLKIMNSAPRPDRRMTNAQAAAVRISGDMTSFYNCRFHGFQDTFCDDYGKHFFKDCYIEGTVDFVFGGGQSIYMNTEIHVIDGETTTYITAHSRKQKENPSGYVFVHCNVTGKGPAVAYLGRPWFAYARVVFAYSEMSDVIKPDGWPADSKDVNTIYFGEYNNKGPGANLEKRAAYSKKLTDGDVKPFISLAHIQGSTWLLPPPTINV